MSKLQPHQKNCRWNKPKKICIVGAGPSGIMAARHLSEIQNTEIIVLEAGNDGGFLELQRKECL